jgi:hypothetical protein
MFIVYGFGVIVAILTGSVAALIHASGHAPIGLVSIGVGAALGAIYSSIAIWQGAVRNRWFFLSTVVLAILTVLSEHDCLYLDFCRQWRESRAESPQVAMFRSEAPLSIREYFAIQWTPQMAAFWCLDAVLIIASALGTVAVFSKKTASAVPSPQSSNPSP